MEPNQQDEQQGNALKEGLLAILAGISVRVVGIMGAVFLWNLFAVSAEVMTLTFLQGVLLSLLPAVRGVVSAGGGASKPVESAVAQLVAIGLVVGAGLLISLGL